MAMRGYHEVGEHTQNTSISDPTISFTQLEDDTDEFGRQILKHARQEQFDRQRMHSATHSDGVQAFKYARTRPSIALTLENLERHSNVTAGGKDGLGRHTAQRSIDRGRGTYARRQTSISESETSSPQAVNIPRQWGRKGMLRNDFLRRISAPVISPLKKSPDIGKRADPDTIFRRRSILTGDSPRSDVDWEDAAADVPRQSVEQVSPLRKDLGNGVDLRSWEKDTSDERIMELEAKGEDVVEPDSPTSQASNRKMRTRSRRQRVTEVSDDAAVTFDKIGESAGRRRPLSRTVGNEDGAGMADGSAELTSAPHTKKENGPNALVAVGTGKENEHHRHRPREQSSGDLLKRLAASASPDLQSTREPQMNTITRPSYAQHKLPTPPSEASPVLEASLIPKMPLVTGAYIDTPQPHKASTPIPDPPLSNNNIPLLPPPQRPTSAAAALLQNASNLDTFTVKALRSVVNTTYETTLALDEDTIDLIENVAVPISSTESSGPSQERKEEDALIQRMDERLRAARTGLRDASRGLKRVEKEVEEAVEGEDERNRERHGSCVTYDGITLGSLIRHTWTSFVRNFVVWDGWSPRLTWLGGFWALMMVWTVSEVVLCNYYCHPLYATSMRDYGVDINAPRVPFVTSTILISRPFAWLWKPLWALVQWFWTEVLGFGAIFGWEEDVFLREAVWRAAQWDSMVAAKGFGGDEYL